MTLDETTMKDYIESNKLSKEDALKPENVKLIRQNVTHASKDNDDAETKEKIKKYFEKNANSSSSDNDVAYVFPFGSNAKVEMPTSDDDKKEDDNVGSVGKQDAYVIPMKGLAYEDPEYATTNLK